MRLLIPPLLLTLALACGCEQSSQVQTANKPATPPDTAPAVESPSAPATNPADRSTVTPADNSAVNARDDSPVAKTPIDQNENEADINITAEIRKRVLEQADFSVNARNVKIITADGKVTLRGPVTTEAERDTIKKIAEQVAGETKVESQLEVAP